MVDFLTGTDPITRHVVQRGVDKGAIIVGTIWKDDFAALTDRPKKAWGDRATPLGHDSGTVDELAEPRAILTATYADLIEMPPELDEEESAVASALAKQDSRWAHALADAGELSPIQVLAAAPQLLHRYRSPDDEAGGVVLRTAVALLAMEHPQPVPAELLRQVAHAAMPPTLDLDSERWFDDAVEWARRPVRGTIAPLGLYRSAASGDLGYVAPDLLVSAAREDGGLQDQVDLGLTLTYATTEACASVGSFFYFRDEDDLAEPFLRRAAEGGVVRAFRRYGYVLSEQAGRAAEAESWYLKAVDSADPAASFDLGYLLADQDGRAAEAKQWYLKAVESGNTVALFNLAVLASKGGRDAEAEEWYRKAADAGETDALINLGSMLANQGRVSEAEALFKSAHAAGNTGAMYALGNLAAREGRTVEAESWYLQAADAGNTDAMVGLGTLLFDQEGRADDADEWYRKAIDAGNPDALTHFGDALKEQGRYTEARPVLERAIEGGDPYAMRMMGELDLLEGHHEAGQAWLRRAASLGIKRAGEILREQFDEDPLPPT